MSKEEVLTMQKCVLKVDIHCDACARKVKKILQRLAGIFCVEYELKLKMVTVYGSVVEPAAIIKKLKKKGKHAEIWVDEEDDDGAGMYAQPPPPPPPPPPPCKGVNYEQCYTMFSDENANHLCIIM